ncbi:ABC transporter permease [Streptomyces daliensis]|uniref:ABC transporter permease n=1 Tax=Streptomyces daliensis TaxID=299421 RepID=A0A8T4IJZ0_9ACTN|nr:ABC transporter permease [Streptomyces daliensis]
MLVLVPVIVALALWAFAWPAARTAPRDLPIGVAGPSAAAAPVQQQLEKRDGAFEIHRYDDAASARTAIEKREIYGAVVVTPKGPHALTASAASPVVAQLLEQAVAQQAAARQGGSAADPGQAGPVATDVVAAPEDDPRGAALSSSVLPLAIGGVAAGALVTAFGLRGSRAVFALLGAAALTGVVAGALAGSWLGVLTGDWWGQAGAIGLTALAVSASVAGLAAVLGNAGIGVGALLSVLLGNPFSGVTSAPEMLPGPVGAIGQWLPPGAGGTLLRSVSFFDGHGADTPVLVLTVWAVAGLTLVTIGGLRGRAPVAERPERAREPMAAG